MEWLYEQINIFNPPIKADLLWKFHELRNGAKAEAGDKLIYKGEQHEQDYLRRGEHYLENYFDQNAPFEQGKVVATELLLNFDLQEKQETWWEQKFRGVVDRLDKEWDSFIINDYKTNKHLPPEEKEDYKEQLTLYGYGIQQKYGKYYKKLKARLHYLHFDLIDEREINDEVLDPVLEKYRSAITQIEHARFDHNMGSENAFPTNQNPYCKYCEYQELCPLWKHLNYGDESVDWWSLGEQTIKKLVDRYAKISSETSELNQEKKSLKEILINYAEKKKFEQLFGEENQLSIKKSDTYSAKDKADLQKLLAELWLLEEASDIPYYKLNALIKEKKLNPEQIQNYLTKKDSRRLTPSKKK